MLLVFRERTVQLQFNAISWIGRDEEIRTIPCGSKKIDKHGKTRRGQDEMDLEVISSPIKWIELFLEICRFHPDQISLHFTERYWISPNLTEPQSH